MNEKQRIKDCIHFNEVDKVPWQIDYTTEIARMLMDKLNLQKLNYTVLGKNIYQYNSLDDYFGNHLCYMRSNPVDSYQEIKPDIWKDEWGVIWDRRIDKDIGTPINIVLENMDLGKLKVPDPSDPSRYMHFKPIIKANSGRYFLVKVSRCLFERAWSMRGMKNLMTDFIINPSFVHELFEIITEFNLNILKNLVDYPIDGVRFSDDWGGQLGLLMSPETWRTFVKPYLKRMYYQAHLQGYDVFIHTCGNVTALLDDLIEIGVNVLNPFQPEAMDIENIISRYERRLAFNGGLSIQKTLPFGNTEEVKREVRDRLRLAKKYGGYIISPAHDMPPDIPFQNIHAMLEVFQTQL